jgi:hypothetical protein
MANDLISGRHIHLTGLVAQTGATFNLDLRAVEVSAGVGVYQWTPRGTGNVVKSVPGLGRRYTVRARGYLRSSTAPGLVTAGGAAAATCTVFADASTRKWSGSALVTRVSAAGRQGGRGWPVTVEFTLDGALTETWS